MSRHRAFASGILLVGLAATATIAAAGTGWIPGSETKGAEAVEESVVPVLEFASVTRGSLSSEREFSATVSFGDPWMLTSDATGMVTGSHPVGTVVGDGETIVWIDDRPLVLVVGDMPLYRELRKVATWERDEAGTRLGLQTGTDVEQLQQFLLANDFDADGKLEADGEVGTATEIAVKDWQESKGRPRTGRIDSTQLVFVPEPIRINRELRVGDRFSGLELAQADASVLVDTSNRDRSALPEGSTVEVELADGTTLAGMVVDQKQVDTGGQRVWRTTIGLEQALDGAVTTATVTATRVIVEDVLLVPVGALLALAEGGFAVEISDGEGATRLVGVEVGEVLDGRAEITADLSEGDLVVVPT